MTDPETIEARLRDHATDWNGVQMPDAEPAKGDPTAGTLREAADLIASLRAERDALREAQYAQFLDGMEAAAEICGTLAEHPYDDTDAFEAATGCEAAIMRVVKDARARAALAAGEGGR